METCWLNFIVYKISTLNSTTKATNKLVMTFGGHMMGKDDPTGALGYWIEPYSGVGFSV